MKTINFWRTMLFAAIAVTAFSSCKEDEPDQTTGMPEITVNGQSNLVVAGELQGGKLAPITVVAKGKWSATLPSDGSGSWCTVLPASGSTGTSTIVLDLSQASAERTTTVTLTATGSVAGVPITVKATITVKQNDGGSTVATTNVAEVRAALKAALAAAKPADGTKVDVPADLAAMTLTGIVVSNASTDNMGNKYLIAVSDPSGAAHSGLTVNGTKFKDLALTPGKVITASLAGAQMQIYRGLSQLSLADAVEVKVDNGEALAATVITADKILDYESQYVKIENSQAMDGAFNVAWYVSDGNKGNVDFITKDGDTFVVRTSQYATYKDQIVTDKSGYIMGIAGRFNDDKQLSPQSADDIAHLDQARIQAEYIKVTINNLAAGNYEVDGTIVAVHSKGVLVADNAGGKNNYVLSFFNDWTLQTSNPFQDKVNFLANVKGISKDQYGLWQFTAPTITTTTASVFDNGTPAAFDGPAIDTYAKAIIADQANTTYKYVKLTGVTVTIGTGGSGATAYKTYTLTVPGLPAGTPVTSVVATYAFDTYFAGVNSGDIIDITGFALGYDTKGNKLNIMTTKVEKNTDVAALNAAVSSVAFAAAGEAKTVAYTQANLGTNKVFAKITGADAAAFTVAAGEQTSPITVTAAANTGTTAKSATLRIYAASAVDGAEVVFDEVTLSQDAPNTSGDTKGTYTSMDQFISDGGPTANPAGLGESLAGGKPVSGFKIGTGSKVGSFTSDAVGVAGSKKLGFYAIGWTKKPGATLKITVNGGGSASKSEFTLTGVDGNGATGNPPFLVLKYDDATDYYVVDLTGLTADSTITFETIVASNGRAVVCGVQLF